MYRFVKEHRYNTAFTTLKPGYYDKDQLMLHACFQLLVDYVEREKGLEVIKFFWTTAEIDAEMKDNSLFHWDYYASIGHVGNEIKDLYDWWTKVYLPQYPGYVVSNCRYPTIVADEIVQKQFLRLAAIREHLWT